MAHKRKTGGGGGGEDEQKRGASELRAFRTAAAARVPLRTPRLSKIRKRERNKMRKGCIAFLDPKAKVFIVKASRLLISEDAIRERIKD